MLIVSLIFGCYFGIHKSCNYKENTLFQTLNLLQMHNKLLMKKISISKDLRLVFILLSFYFSGNDSIKDVSLQDVANLMYLGSGGGLGGGPPPPGVGGGPPGVGAVPPGVGVGPQGGAGDLGPPLQSHLLSRQIFL